MLTEAVDISFAILLVCHVVDEKTWLAHCVLQLSLQLSQVLADILDCLLDSVFLNQLVLECAHHKYAQLWQLAFLLLLGALVGHSVHAGEGAQHHLPP